MRYLYRLKVSFEGKFIKYVYETSIGAMKKRIKELKSLGFVIETSHLTEEN